ncbi:MAG: thioesterase family protein [Pseudomonadota bacterium]
MTTPELSEPVGEGWDLPRPFLIEHAVAKEDIDGLGHANNTSYMRWCERVSWAHSASLGITLATYRATRRAMVIRRCEYDYLAAAYPEEPLALATWVVECDGIIRIVRRFQIRNARDGRTLLRARTEFACINLDTGRATRMPQAFADTYSSVLAQIPDQHVPNRPS